MNCNELKIRLKELQQHRSPVYIDPPDGKGGLYEICETNRLASNGKLPHAVLVSIGSLEPIEPMTAECLQKFLCRMPEESEVFYDNGEPLSKLVPIQNAGLLE